MSQPQPPTVPDPPPAAPTTPPTTPPAAPLAAIGSRLTRYRVMAWITGVMLLLLCLEMLLKYVFQVSGVDGDGRVNPVMGNWVALVHGWIYVIYLVTVAQLWSAIRWPGGRLLTMVLAGVVPVMSFVVEHRVHRDAADRIAQAERALAEGAVAGDTRRNEPPAPTTLSG